jgi:Transcriptional regulator, AbiEi antitoxin
MPQADATIAALALTSHGVVTRTALLEAGLTDEHIRHRLSAGSLHREHPGVYRVGHRAPSPDATYTAAVLAGGTSAALAGHAAAWRFGLVGGPAPRPEIATGAVRRRIEGVVCRRGASDPRDRMTWRGLQTVTPPRALVEVAAELDLDALARACHEAGVRFRTTPRHVADALSRWPAAPGGRRLRAVIGGDTKVTLSRLERGFIALLRREGLPLPVTNRAASGRRVDCRWPELRLTVELDSYAFHNSRYAWERDRRREREAYARGDDLRRYTWSDVMEAPAAMLRELHALVRSRHPAGVVPQEDATVTDR